MPDLFDYAQIELEEEVERYCVFCEETMPSSEVYEHALTTYHQDQRRAMLEARNPDNGYCGACQYLEVENDIDFYCFLEFSSVLAPKGQLNTEEEGDGRLIPTQPTGCRVVNIWGKP